VTAEGDRVPRSLRVSAAIAWRILVVAGAIAVLAVVLARLRVIVVPVAVAILFSTALVPLARWLRAHGLPAGLAALAVLLCALLLVGAAATGIVAVVADDVDELDVSVAAGIDEATEWLSDGPLNLSEERLDRWQAQASEELRSRSGDILGGIFGGAYIALEVVAGLVLAVVTLFFLLKDGERLWLWLVRLFPPEARADVQAIGERAWETAGGYIRGVSLVALVDAVFIGLALWLIGVPFVVPLASLVFVGGFFPIVGAVVAGFVSAMVALVWEGFIAALLVVGATLLVQQLEGNILQPFIVGNAVRLHPLAVLLAITAGGILWGVTGAFLAVPLVAVVATAVRQLAGDERAASRGAAAPARDPAPTVSEGAKGG
jgi:predicted PurR-regulated permease PerM